MSSPYYGHAALSGLRRPAAATALDRTVNPQQASAAMKDENLNLLARELPAVRYSRTRGDEAGEVYHLSNAAIDHLLTAAREEGRAEALGAAGNFQTSVKP